MLALTVANLKMMVRNRQTAFWALFFPVMLVVVFGLFDFSGVSSTNVAIIDLSQGPKSELLQARLQSIELLDVADLSEKTLDRAQAAEDLASGDLGYLVVIPPDFDAPGAAGPDAGTPDADTREGQPAPVVLAYTTRNPERNQLVDGAVRSVVAEIGASGGPVIPSRLIISSVIEARPVDYFDTVLLGLLALGIMTNSIISIAVRISTYRNQAILKRLLVTPLPIWKFFAGEITAHLVLALLQGAIILSLGVYVFGGQVHGNLAWLLLITVLGSIVFLNLGFILSAWARTPAAASGMGNALALPMMFFAGTFFSTASLPGVLPYVAEALPLTPMLEALRAVALDQAPIGETWPHLAALAGWAAATGIAATRLFKFS